MAIDRDPIRDSWRRRVVSTGRRWLTVVVLLSVAVASLLAYLLTSGPVQFSARAALTALVLAAGGKQATQVLRSVRAYNWARWRRFAWLQYGAMAAGVLVTLLPGYVLLVFLYPVLHSSPLTSVAVVMAMVLAVLAVVLLALTCLALLIVLLWLPVLIVRTLLRERQRRYYRFPSR